MGSGFWGYVFLVFNFQFFGFGFWFFEIRDSFSDVGLRLSGFVLRILCSAMFFRVEGSGVRVSGEGGAGLPDPSSGS